MKTSTRSISAALLAAAALTLTGCSGSLTIGNGSPDTDSPAAAAPPDAKRPASSAPDVIAADVRKVANAFEKKHAKTGSYMGAKYKSVALTGDNYLASVAAVSNGFLVCVAEPVTGAWALWESIDHDITQSGDADAECGPTQTVGG
jgi:hypothetical protein